MPRKLRTPLIATLEHFRAIVVTHGLSERDALQVLAGALKYLELTDGDDLSAAELAILRSGGEQLAQHHLDLVEEGATQEIDLVAAPRPPAAKPRPPSQGPPLVDPAAFDDESKTEQVVSPWHGDTAPRRPRDVPLPGGDDEPVR